MKQKILLVIVIVAPFLFYTLFKQFTFRQARLNTETVFSKSPSGVSILRDLTDRSAENLSLVKQTAVLTEVRGRSTYALFAPLIPYSEREAKLLKIFVEKGGSLLISIKSPSQLKNVQSILESLDMSLKLKELESFENGSPIIARAKEETWLFEPFKGYAFYSAYVFDTPECQRRSFDCFVEHQPVGEGQVTVIAGMSPLTNGLIGLEQNPSLALRLLEHSRTIQFDEHKHFFSEKTLLDLFLTPSFILPIIGMVGGALVFFLFGYSDFHWKTEQPTRDLAQYHEVNRAILHGFLEKRGGRSLASLEVQVRYLRQNFPEKAEQISSLLQGVNPSVRDVSAKLLDLHRQALRERRGL